MMTRNRGDQEEESGGLPWRKRRSCHEFVEGLHQLLMTIDGTEFVVRILRGRAEEVGIGDEEEELGGRRE
jgi:hypothetical protein